MMSMFLLLLPPLPLLLLVVVVVKIKVIVHRYHLKDLPMHHLRQHRHPHQRGRRVSGHFPHFCLVRAHLLMR